MHLVGAEWLLGVSPVWLTALWLFFFGTTLGLGFILANRTYGVYTCVSYAGHLGDMFLAVIVLIGATILRRAAAGQVSLPVWLTGPAYQVGLALVATVVAAYLLVSKRNALWSPTLSDRYHNIVVCWLFVFLLPLVAPVILLAGDRLEILATLGCGGVYIVLLLKDIKEKRLDQPRWMREHQMPSLQRRRRP